MSRRALIPPAQIKSELCRKDGLETKAIAYIKQIETVSMQLSGVTFFENTYAIAQYPLSLPRIASSTGFNGRGLGSNDSITA